MLEVEAAELEASLDLHEADGGAGTIALGQGRKLMLVIPLERIMLPLDAFVASRRTTSRSGSGLQPQVIFNLVAISSLESLEATCDLLSL